MGASTLFFQSLGFFTQGISYVNELNKSLTEISIVTGKTQQEMELLGQTYNQLAQDMGVLTNDIANATKEFVRQGLSQEEVMKRTGVATQYAKISALDFKTSAEVLTATVNSMNVDIERASDVFTYLGDSTATGADEVGKAFQRVGGTAGAVGLEFEKVASWIAVLSSRTREGAGTIGNSVKSILARFQSLQEKGFTEEDGTQVNDVAKALNEVNIALMDSSGNFRNFGTVMDELGSKWQGIDNRTRAYLATVLAGTYQQSKFLNLMEGYQDTIPLYEQSLLSAGQTQQKFDQYLQGTEAQLNKLKATWEGVWMSSFDSDAIRAVIASLDLFAKGLKVSIDALGLLPIIAGTATAGFLLFNKTARASVMGQGLLATSFVKTGDSMRIATGASRGYQVALYNLTLGARATSAAVGVLGNAVRSVGTFIKGVALPVLAITAFSYAVGKLTEKYMEARQEKERAEKQTKNMIESYQKESDKIKSLVSEYTTLSEARSNKTIDTEKESRYVELQNELAKLLPSVVQGVNSKGDSILMSTEKINDQIKSLERLIYLEEQQARQKAPKKIEKSTNVIADLKEEMDYQNDVIKSKQKQREALIADKGSRAEILAIETQITEWQIKKEQSSIRINEETKKIAENSKALFSNMKLDEETTNQVAELIGQMDLVGKDSGEIEGMVLHVADAVKKFNDESNKPNSDKLPHMRASLEKLLESYGMAPKYIDEFTNSVVGQNNATDNVVRKQEDAVKVAEALQKQYDNSISAIESLNGVLNDLNKGEGLSGDKIGLLMEKYPHLLALLGDETELRKAIQVEIVNEAKIAKQAIIEKMKDSTTFYTSMLASNTAIVNKYKEDYGIDLSNYKSLAEAKVAINNQLVERLTQQWNDYYGQLIAQGDMEGASHIRPETYVQMWSSQANADFDNIAGNFVDSTMGSAISGSGLTPPSGSGSSGQSEADKAAEEAQRKKEQAIKDVITLYKDGYKMLQEVAVENINKEKEAFEKAHEEKIKKLDEQLKLYEDIINKQIESIDKQEEEYNWNRRLTDSQNDRQAIIDKMNALQLDNSFAAKKQMDELRVQLAEIDTNITDMQHEREIELRKENLQSLLEARQLQTEQTKNAEQLSYDSGLANFEARIAGENRFYENLMNDERAFQGIADKINSGNTDGVTDYLSWFNTQIGSFSDILGESISNNFIDAIARAISMLNSKNYSGSVFPTQFHEGGVVGVSSPPNRLTELANKLFNVKPGEQIIKSLVGELQIPPKNIPNLFTNINGMVNSLLSNRPNASAEGNMFTIQFNIDKFTGSQGDMDNLFDMANRRMLARGIKPI